MGNVTFSVIIFIIYPLLVQLISQYTLGFKRNNTFLQWDGISRWPLLVQQYIDQRSSIIKCNVKTLIRQIHQLDEKSGWYRVNGDPGSGSLDRNITDLLTKKYVTNILKNKKIICKNKTKMAQCLSHQASTSSDEHRAIILTDDSFSCSTQPEDSIEFISQVILADDLPKEPSKQSKKYEKPRAEPENRKVSRCVALIAFLLLAVCFALMGVSFTLTSKIDEMVRNSNSVLRKHNLAMQPQEHVTNESYFN